MFVKKMNTLGAVVLMIFSTLAMADVDTLPSYQKSSGISGKISSVGSDTLANLMTLWAEEFKREYPNVTIQIQAAGSSTAPPALTEGTSSFGPMSRKMKDKENAAFEEKYGYKATPIRVAIDALAVYVHKDNKLEGLSIPEVDAIFSATRKCGYAEDIVSWSQLGSNLGSIQVYGRNSVSGTYGYFKKKALCKGDYKDQVNEQPGSASVVQGVTKSLNGIGYKTSGVKALALSKKRDGKMIAATKKNAANGSYPLSRYLYVYVNKAPNKPMAPLDREFIKMVLSKVGQRVVVKDGYVPLPLTVVEKELAKIQ